MTAGLLHGQKYLDSGLLLHRRQSFMKADWVYRRGDIYLANLNPFKGSEQGGKRPVVVLQNNIGNRHSSTLIIAPITSRVEKNTGQPTHVNIGRIGYNHVLSVVQLEQIRTIDKQRVIRYFGRIDRSMMKKVEEGMLISLGIKGFDRRGECIGTNHDNRSGRAGE